MSWGSVCLRRGPYSKYITIHTYSTHCLLLSLSLHPSKQFQTRFEIFLSSVSKVKHELSNLSRQSQSPTGLRQRSKLHPPMRTTWLSWKLRNSRVSAPRVETVCQLLFTRSRLNCQLQFYLCSLMRFSWGFLLTSAEGKSALRMFSGFSIEEKIPPLLYSCVLHNPDINGLAWSQVHGRACSHQPQSDLWSFHSFILVHLIR